MNEKKITLTFDLEQVANDILTKCNLISTSIRDEALADIRANVMEPDNPELRSIINRSVTEAFGEVKKACQRYLKVGRDTDNNLLERMVSSITYQRDENDQLTDEIDAITYEEVELELYIPNFNVSVTDVLKSHIHRYVVDYTLGQFLQDQVPDKAAEYADKADGPENKNSDMRKIRNDLTARERFNLRKPSWI